MNTKQIELQPTCGVGAFARQCADECAMHLSPAALEDAIRLLDGDGHGVNRGEIVEAAGTENPSR